MRKWPWLIAALMLNSPAIAADGTPVGAGQTATLNWLQRPTGDDFAKYYPLSRIEHGAAVLHCNIGPDGLLENCAVDAESPKGMGVAQATLKISHLFRLTPDAAKARSIFETTVLWRIHGPRPLTDDEQQVDAPPWTSTPTTQNLEDAFPREQIGLLIKGSVVMHCIIVDDGSLYGCRIKSAAPQGKGFEQAAQQLSAQFKVDPLWRSNFNLLVGTDITINMEEPKVNPVFSNDAAPTGASPPH